MYTSIFTKDQIKELPQIFFLYGGGMNTRWICTGKHEPIILMTCPETTNACFGDESFQQADLPLLREESFFVIHSHWVDPL